MDKIKGPYTGDIPGWMVDYEADAAYMQLRDATVVETVRYDIVNIDLDDGERVVGIELLTLHPDRHA